MHTLLTLSWLLPVLFMGALPLPVTQCQTKPLVRDIDTLRSYLIRTGSIGGRVAILGSKTVPPNLVITMRDSSNLQRSVHTNSAGQYSFTLLPPGPYWLWARARGFITGYERVDIEAGHSRTMDVGLVPDYSNPTMHTTGAIVGTVTDSADNHQSLEADILLVNTTRAIKATLSGNFALYDLGAGWYTVLVSASDHKTVSVDSVLVRSGKATTLDVRLPRAGMPRTRR